MPACEVTDVDVQIWNALETRRFCPGAAPSQPIDALLNIEAMYGAAVYKEVLRRRGVIACAAMRGPGLVTLDGFDEQELDAILQDISELFTLAPAYAH